MDRVILHQVVLVKLDYLLLYEGLDIGEILRVTLAGLRQCQQFVVNVLVVFGAASKTKLPR